MEFLDRIIPGADSEIAKKFLQICKKQGMKFELGTKVCSSEIVDGKVKLDVEVLKNGKTKEIMSDVVLVSTGRRPFTAGLGLEGMGIETDRLGRVVVDEHFKTKVPCPEKRRPPATSDMCFNSVARSRDPEHAFLISLKA